MKHAGEFRRCLLNLDVSGMMKLWKHVAPHLSGQGPAEALTSMHIARCEMETIPERMRIYSEEWLADRGYRKIDGKWVEGLPPPAAIASGVGIAVKSSDPVVAKRIHGAMSDALENAIAKGIIEAPVQKEAMLKARAKERFKMRLA